MGNRNSEMKVKFKEAQEQKKIINKLEELDKSSNERELERYVHEEREKEIKSNLELFRKKREHEDNYEHNPLKIPNIMNKRQNEILKSKKLFCNQGNMFTHQKRIY